MPVERNIAAQELVKNALRFEGEYLTASAHGVRKIARVDADIGADIHNRHSRAQIILEKLHLSFRELAVQIQGAADIFVIGIEHHRAMPASLQPQIAVLDQSAIGCAGFLRMFHAEQQSQLSLDRGKDESPIAGGFLPEQSRGRIPWAGLTVELPSPIRYHVKR